MSFGNIRSAVHSGDHHEVLAAINSCSIDREEVEDIAQYVIGVMGYLPVGIYYFNHKLMDYESFISAATKPCGPLYLINHFGPYLYVHYESIRLPDMYLGSILKEIRKICLKLISVDPSHGWLVALLRTAEEKLANKEDVRWVIDQLDEHNKNDPLTTDIMWLSNAVLCGDFSGAYASYKRGMDARHIKVDEEEAAFCKRLINGTFVLT